MPTPNAVLDKFPEYLEIYLDDDENITSHKFVIERNNARSLTTSQSLMCRMLEKLGLTVVIRVGSEDLTLDEFNKGGAYQALGKLTSRQTIYNYAGELRKMELLLASMPLDHPQRIELEKKVERYKWALGTIQTPANVQIQTSNEALDELVKLAETETKPTGS